MLLLCHYLIWWRNLPAAASGKLLLAIPRCRLLSKKFLFPASIRASTGTLGNREAKCVRATPMCKVRCGHPGACPESTRPHLAPDRAKRVIMFRASKTPRIADRSIQDVAIADKITKTFAGTLYFANLWGFGRTPQAAASRGNTPQVKRCATPPVQRPKLNPALARRTQHGQRNRKTRMNRTLPLQGGRITRSRGANDRDAGTVGDSREMSSNSCVRLKRYSLPLVHAACSYAMHLSLSLKLHGYVRHVILNMPFPFRPSSC